MKFNRKYMIICTECEGCFNTIQQWKTHDCSKYYALEGE